VWDSGAAIPSKATLDNYIFEQAKQAQLDLIDEAYWVAMQQSVSYMGHMFQADLSSQNTLNKAIVSLQGLVAIGGTFPPDFGWASEDNTMVPMTLVQLQGLAASMLIPAWTAFARQQTRKATIRAATTLAEVVAVIW
jgi:hypothetical protein